MTIEQALIALLRRVEALEAAMRTNNQIIDKGFTVKTADDKKLFEAVALVARNAGDPELMKRLNDIFTEPENHDKIEEKKVEETSAGQTVH